MTRTCLNCVKRIVGANAPWTCMNCQCYNVPLMWYVTSRIVRRKEREGDFVESEITAKLFDAIAAFKHFLHVNYENSYQFPFR